MKLALPFVKRVAQSGKACLVWIPKDVSDFLSVQPNLLLEFKIVKITPDGSRSQQLVFSKKPSSSKQGYLVWVPKNIADFLSIKKGNFVEMIVSKIEAEKNE